LGLVESQLDWNPTRLRTLPEFAGWPRYAPKDEEFMLVALPPPIEEGVVIEYVNTRNFPNTPGGVYRYSTFADERPFLDDARSGWSRTGKSFKQGGYVGVCGFYGSASPGPNSYFYTAVESECNTLKAIQVKPRPTNRQQLNYEGIAFYANLPIPAKVAGGAPTCPTQSTPLYRAYNAAPGLNPARRYDGNHRFTTSRADIAAVVALGWIDEGIVMCIPI
jgi:hypothetical protein